jgi:hypothetical protein
MAAGITWVRGNSTLRTPLRKLGGDTPVARKVLCIAGNSSTS